MNLSAQTLLLAAAEGHHEVPVVDPSAADGVFTLLGLITAMGSFFVIWFSKDLAALDTMDFWVGTAMIFVLAMVQVILFAWVFGTDRGVRPGHSAISKSSVSATGERRC